MIKRLSNLAKENQKQVILTSHNPASLDGLNINDEDNRLFVIERNNDGKTICTRVQNKSQLEEPMRLSEAWMRGYLGGIPKYF